MISRIVRITQTTQAVRRLVAFFLTLRSLKTACANAGRSYHSWASPDCVLPDASGNFLPEFELKWQIRF
jgi:hypothetical protein